MALTSFQLGPTHNLALWQPQAILAIQRWGCCNWTDAWGPWRQKGSVGWSFLILLMKRLGLDLMPFRRWD